MDPRTREKQKKRDARERELAEKILSLPAKKYGVILADPPWRFEPYSRVTGMDRAADNHYPTMLIKDIWNVPVKAIAHRDCILYLWATAPMLDVALRVMSVWGFTYKSHAVWIKDKIGTGYWFRSMHEILLLGTTGTIPAPAPGTQFTSVIAAPRGKHSEKPEVVHEIIEEMFPTIPKIELYRRGPPRDGWDAWGNEAETDN